VEQHGVEGLLGQGGERLPAVDRGASLIALVLEQLREQ